LKEFLCENGKTIKDNEMKRLAGEFRNDIKRNQKSPKPESRNKIKKPTEDQDDDEEEEEDNKTIDESIEDGRTQGEEEDINTGFFRIDWSPVCVVEETYLLLSAYKQILISKIKEFCSKFIYVLSYFFLSFYFKNF